MNFDDQKVINDTDTIPMKDSDILSSSESMIEV
jgi:hypothetical protein